MKISLSYSTMNALLKEPHTYLNKMMGLKTFQTEAMKEGESAHGIIQRHISGGELHPVLLEKGLPTFSLVERERWDEQMRVRFDINDKYYFTGFLDGDDPERQDLLEIKTGKVWSASEFARLIQWKLYSLGRPDHKKMWMVNTPRDSALWIPETIRIFNTEITPAHKREAELWITQALFIIENIKEAVETAQKAKAEKGYKGRSRYCYYTECSWCTGDAMQ